MRPYILGLKWDQYTPQVQAQIVRDLLALQAQPNGRNMSVYYEGNDRELNQLLEVMGINRTPTRELARLWVFYQTGAEPLEIGDEQEVVVRNLHVKAVDPARLNPNESPGFYLPPQGRQIAPTLDLNRPMPGWYPGGPTPDIVWLWG